MGETKKAVHHSETALEIASALSSTVDLYRAHFNLAVLFAHQGRFSDAQAHIEHVKSFAAKKAYFLAQVLFLQANLWYIQHMFGEAKSEVLAALDAFEKLGSTTDAQSTRWLLMRIDAQLPGQPGYS